MPSFRAQLIKEKKMVDVIEIDFIIDRIKYVVDETGEEIACFNEIELIQATGVNNTNDKNF